MDEAVQEAHAGKPAPRRGPAVPGPSYHPHLDPGRDGTLQKTEGHPPSPKPASPWAVLVTRWCFQGTPAPSPAPGPRQGGRVFTEVSTWGAVYTGVSLGSWSLKLSSSSPPPSK